MVGQRTRKITSPESHIRSNDKNSEQHKIASLFAVEIINYSNEEKGKDCERTKLDTSMCSASFDWRSCERPCQRRLFSRNLFEICSVWRAQKKVLFCPFFASMSTEAPRRPLERAGFMSVSSQMRKRQAWVYLIFVWHTLLMPLSSIRF